MLLVSSVNSRDGWMSRGWGIGQRALSLSLAAALFLTTATPIGARTVSNRNSSNNLSVPVVAIHDVNHMDIARFNTPSIRDIIYPGQGFVIPGDGVNPTETNNFLGGTEQSGIQIVDLRQVNERSTQRVYYEGRYLNVPGPHVYSQMTVRIPSGAEFSVRAIGENSGTFYDDDWGTQEEAGRALHIFAKGLSDVIGWLDYTDSSWDGKAFDITKVDQKSNRYGFAQTGFDSNIIALSLDETDVTAEEITTHELTHRLIPHPPNRALNEMYALLVTYETSGHLPYRDLERYDTLEEIMALDPNRSSELCNDRRSSDFKRELVEGYNLAFRAGLDAQRTMPDVLRATLERISREQVVAGGAGYRTFSRSRWLDFMREEAKELGYGPSVVDDWYSENLILHPDAGYNNFSFGVATK